MTTPFHITIQSDLTGYSLDAGYGAAKYSAIMLSHWFLDDLALCRNSLHECRELMRCLRRIRALLRAEGKDSGNVPAIEAVIGINFTGLWLQTHYYTLPGIFNDASVIDGLLPAPAKIEYKLADTLATLEVWQETTLIAYA